MEEQVSVIIPTKNRVEDALETIRTLLIQSQSPKEIIVIDSSDTKKLEEILKEKANPLIKYTHTEKAGRCCQRNLGIKHSTGDILVFLDDDVILDKDFLKEIMSVFYSYPLEKIGGVTSPSKMNEMGFKRKVFLIAYDFLATIFFLPRNKDGKFQLSGMPTTLKPDGNKVEECEFLYGFSMSFRKEVIEEMGGFDEKLEAYSGIIGDDDDIAYRVSRKYQNFHTPFAKLIHNKSPSSRESKYEVMRNGVLQYHYLFKKNIPQTLKYKTAFWWALGGLFIYWGIMSLIKRDKTILQGMVVGVNQMKNGL